MPEPRGPTGAVSALPPEEVRRVLEPLAREILKEGGQFRRAEVRDRIEARTGLSREVAENLVTAFLRSTGAFRSGKGQWRLPPEADRYIKNRDWRLHVGRLGPADAAALVGIMDQHAAALTPRLRDAWTRLAAGLRAINVRAVRPHERKDEP